MALPPNLQQNLMPTELNFLAENDSITILPRYSMKKLDLVGVCMMDNKGVFIKITNVYYSISCQL